MDDDQPQGSAQALIAEFGSLGGVLAAAPEAIERVLGARHRAIGVLSATGRALEHVLRCRIERRPISTIDQPLIDFLVATMGDLPRERVRVLYLDRGNRLVSDEIVAQGSVGEAHPYARDIIARALELQASAMIVAHNHPGGDPEPSASDIAFTRRLSVIADTLDLAVHDHLVIAGSACASMRRRGLL